MKKFIFLCLLAFTSLGAFAQKHYNPGVTVYFGDRQTGTGPHAHGCSRYGICDLAFMDRAGESGCSTCPQAEAELTVLNGRAAFRFNKSSFQNDAGKFFANGLFVVDSLCTFSADDLKGSGIPPFKVAAGKYKIVDQGTHFFIQF